jgi:ribosomal-protein-alanine N-acetyltransferase
MPAYLRELPLRGPRLELREPHADDWDAYVDLVTASRDHLAPWSPGTEEMGPVDAQLDGLIVANRDGRGCKLLIWRTADNQLLGGIGINNIIRGAGQMATLGYWIGAGFTRHGYMREALSLAIEYAFTTLELHRVEANIRPNNEASLALVRGLGFRHEGTSKRFIKIAGEWADHERFALTVEEVASSAPVS